MPTNTDVKPFTLDQKLDAIGGFLRARGVSDVIIASNVEALKLKLQTVKSIMFPINDETDVQYRARVSLITSTVFDNVPDNSIAILGSHAVIALLRGGREQLDCLFRKLDPELAEKFAKDAGLRQDSDT